MLRINHRAPEFSLPIDGEGNITKIHTKTKSQELAAQMLIGLGLLEQ